jgi:hypothetical protein
MPQCFAMSKPWRRIRYAGSTTPDPGLPAVDFGASGGMSALGRHARPSYDDGLAAPAARKATGSAMRETATRVLVAVSIVLPGAALAQNSAPAPVREQSAFDLVTRMSDALEASRAFTFHARSSAEIAAGTGQLVTVFSEADVEVSRPGGLRVAIRGDAAPFDFYYDGKQVAVFEPTLNLYAVKEAPATLDEMLRDIDKAAGVYFPFADVLLADPALALTEGATGGFAAGRAMIGGLLCDHLAFTGPTVDWQIWIAAEGDAVPCMLSATYVDVHGLPRFTVSFSDWNLKATADPARFAFAPPVDAGQIEFSAIDAR